MHTFSETKNTGQRTLIPFRYKLRTASTPINATLIYTFKLGPRVALSAELDFVADAEGDALLPDEAPPAVDEPPEVGLAVEEPVAVAVAEPRVLVTVAPVE